MAEGHFGDDDDRAPNWICCGDSNRLFRIPVLRGQWSEKWQQQIKWLNTQRVFYNGQLIDNAAPKRACDKEDGGTGADFGA